MSPSRAAQLPTPRSRSGDCLCRGSRGPARTPGRGSGTSQMFTKHSQCKRDPELFIRDRELFMRDRELFIRDRELFMRDPELFMRDRELFMRDRELFMRDPGAFHT